MHALFEKKCANFDLKILKKFRGLRDCDKGLPLFACFLLLFSNAFALLVRLNLRGHPC